MRSNLDDEVMDIIPIHFNVPEHSLPLNEFISTALSTQAIIDNLNREFFDGRLKYKLLVLPPRQGTFLESLGLVVLYGYPVWMFLNSSVGKAYLKGLTGQAPEYWAEKFGEKTKEFILSENDLPSPIHPPINISDSTEPQTIELKQEAPERLKIASNIVVQLTLGFLEKEPDDLQKIGISKSKFREAYQARNRIYQTCIDNSHVQGIGFNQASRFSIRRSEFPKYIVEVPPEEIIEEHPTWKVEIKDIKVNSPNWKRDGRKWQAECDTDKEVWFSIEDDAFWHHVKIKDIKPDINDNMKVQWAYPADASRRSNLKVLKVLSYNGKKISDPLNADQLQKELQKYSLHEEPQPDLFH